jgi:hypothetical protein
MVHGEAFDRGLDAMPKPRTGQVPVDQLHLGLLAFARQACRRQAD